MSQGIGRQAADHLGDQLTTVPHAHLAVQRGDVFSSLRHEGKAYPLGRYLKNRIRSAAGLSEDLCKPVRQIDAQASALAKRMKYQAQGKTVSESYLFASAEEAQRVLNAESRVKIRQQRRRKL